ncbi:sec-independent protein translocase protein TatA [Paracoccus thiocyanatus]|uniref:Sec-independent protein translocase protein TatA n=1 Tax=Paracoccus thiocyanatus TaxID=34006 RepID=A0A1N6SJP4_9RHOB|nr:twin-arginine translocase TatA/TatE family subunit [Paracoccus thiocyanatus]SIQ41166.1 sec-independent protein translocase protein TatA [Paracoccus thiocyanatus]
MLNNIGLPGLLLIAVVVLVLFGRGKVSSLMGEVGKGITAFKKGVKDGSDEYDRAAEDAAKPIGQSPAEDAARAQAQTNEALRDVTPQSTDRS